MTIHYPVIVGLDGISHLACSGCGKSVSSGFLPIPTDTPDRGIVVRAFVQCPECIEKDILGEPKPKGER